VQYAHLLTVASEMSFPKGVPVSAMVFTLDEELHLPSCLAALAWTDDVIVVDSFSRDRTEAIARAAGARFYQHAFEGFGKQRVWALGNTDPKYEWILILDADERVTPELARELERILPATPENVAAFRVKRRFHMWGRWLKRSNLYPTWVVRLVRKGRVRYVDRGHAETQETSGEVRDLENDLIDENRKGLDEWFERQNRYSTKEAEFELRQEAVPGRVHGLFARDPLARRASLKLLASRLPFRPALYFVYTYLLRGGFLEGRDGLVFCLMKSAYQRMIVVKKHDMRRRRSSGNGLPALEDRPEPTRDRRA
jgi:glycosyltransferase involved in cell wall biosynthesis